MLNACLLALLLQQNGQQQSADQDRPNPYRVYQLKELETAKIKIKDKHELTVWIMDTYGKRMEGMMFLRSEDFTEKQGMIFVFKKPEIQRFWMRNTLVPLDVAYIGSDGTINSTYTMKALDETTDYSSAKPSKYVLEVKAGLFKKLSIGVGDKVAIPKEVKAKD